MSKNSKNYILQAAMILAYIMMIVVNLLASLLPLNGVTTQEVAERYPNLFVPAGITFAIWGVIYTLLLLFVIYTVCKLNQPKEVEKLGLVKIGWLFVGTCFANSAWLFAWHYDYIFISVLVMILLLILLIKIYSSIPSDLTRSQYIFLKLPFSVYLGWITVATVANITAFLVSIGWNGFGLPEVFWTVIMMMVALGLALVFIWKYHDPVYALVIAWALLGILINHRTVYEGQYAVVQIAAYFGIGIILANSIYMLWLEAKNDK
ncbi:hypothetical protein [Cellulosilyticum sp. I15G10I2]|uniref:hypothetical protein n=1 Tax=Cellulosilyticum sp. I15G10I2 TaxID=1892843 RepID=UPI00085C8D6D|nr:hypothetical protein [Cellulosilyticum sp. I15G10I2]